MLLEVLCHQLELSKANKSGCDFNTRVENTTQNVCCLKKKKKKKFQNLFFNLQIVFFVDWKINLNIANINHLI